MGNSELTPYAKRVDVRWVRWLLHQALGTAWLISILLCPTLSADSPQHAKLPAELKKAEESIAQAEGFVESGAGIGIGDVTRYDEVEKSRKKLLARLKNADAETSRYLKKDPNNIEVLFLQVRLDLVKVLITPVVIERGKVQRQDVPSPARDPQKTLDRILEIDPSNAAGYYLKARLYGLETFGQETLEFFGQEGGVHQELDKAVQYARMAVERAPDNAQYRFALVAYLVRSGDRAEARKVASHMDNGKYPLALLLDDLQKVPVPEGAIANLGGAAALIEQMTPEDPLALFRVTSYTLLKSADEVRSFYERTWKGFHFRLSEDYLPDSKAELGSHQELRIWQAQLDWRDGELVPVPLEDAKARKWSEVTGVSLRLTELRHPTPENRKRLKIGDADVVCEVDVINQRPVGPIRH